MARSPETPSSADSDHGASGTPSNDGSRDLNQNLASKVACLVEKQHLKDNRASFVEEQDAKVDTQDDDPQTHDADTANVCGNGGNVRSVVLAGSGTQSRFSRAAKTFIPGIGSGQFDDEEEGHENNTTSTKRDETDRNNDIENADAAERLVSVSSHSSATGTTSTTTNYSDAASNENNKHNAARNETTRSEQHMSISSPNVGGDVGGVARSSTTPNWTQNRSISAVERLSMPTAALQGGAGQSGRHVGAMIGSTGNVMNSGINPANTSAPTFTASLGQQQMMPYATLPQQPLGGINPVSGAIGTGLSHTGQNSNIFQPFSPTALGSLIPPGQPNFQGLPSMPQSLDTLAPPPSLMQPNNFTMDLSAGIDSDRLSYGFANAAKVVFQFDCPEEGKKSKEEKGQTGKKQSKEEAGPTPKKPPKGEGLCKWHFRGTKGDGFKCEIPNCGEWHPSRDVTMRCREEKITCKSIYIQKHPDDLIGIDGEVDESSQKSTGTDDKRAGSKHGKQRTSSSGKGKPQAGKGRTQGTQHLRSKMSNGPTSDAPVTRGKGLHRSAVKAEAEETNHSSSLDEIPVTQQPLSALEFDPAISDVNAEADELEELRRMKKVVVDFMPAIEGFRAILGGHEVARKTWEAKVTDEEKAAALQQEVKKLEGRAESAEKRAEEAETRELALKMKLADALQKLNHFLPEAANFTPNSKCRVCMQLFTEPHQY